MNKHETPESHAHSGSKEGPMNRRTFLKDAGLMASGLVAASMLPEAAVERTKATTRDVPAVWQAPSGRPNILVILVDQLRFPQGLFDQALMDS